MFVSLFMLWCRAGTSSSTPDFCQLRFRGVSSYVKLIPELASSHMVLIASFFPADLAGSQADLLHQDSSTWARPKSTRERGIYEDAVNKNHRQNNRRGKRKRG